MPVSVRLDKLVVSCNIGEPVLPPNPNYWYETATPLPFTRFLESKDFVERPFQAIVIENALVEFTFLPEFGGRLVGIRDKRTGKWALQPPCEVKIDKGVWDHGVSFGTFEMSGFVPDSTDFEVGHGDDSEDVASIIFYSTLPLIEISSQIRVSLASDSPWLEIECSILNRSLSPRQIETGLRVGCSEKRTARYGSGWLCVSSSGDDNWLSVRIAPGDGCLMRRQSFACDLLRMNSRCFLAGVMNDSWNLQIGSMTGISNVDWLTKEFGIGVAESKLTIVSQFGKPKCQIQLTSENGESFQSIADFYPEQPFQASLQSIGELSSISIRHSVNLFHHSFESWPGSNLEIGQLDDCGFQEPSYWESSQAAMEAVALVNDGLDPCLYAKWAKTHVGDRAIANTILAIFECRNSEWDASLAHLDQAIAHEASNGLLWWMRAVVNRQKGDAEDQPDRLNSHFLLPLEPALRAEAFLCQPAITSMDPIPLVASVALHNRAAAEIAAMYWNLGLFRDVVRWVDECCRHRESSWLRIVHAAAYLQLKGKEMEAHTQLQFAASAGIGAPYPTNELEFRILDELMSRFPGVAILEQWSELVEKVRKEKR